jgi:hypothetical protein
VSAVCNGKSTCGYIVDVNALGDPASGCAKNFVAEYRCVPDEARRVRRVPGEAGFGSRLDLSCESDPAARN